MDELMNFFREMVPAPAEIEWGAFWSVIGTVFSFMIGWNAVIEALLVAMVIDYVTGVLAAYVNPQLSLNSQRGFKGICKKIIILLLVCLAHFIDQAMGQQLIQSIVSWFFLGNEGLSIVENAAKVGVPIPAQLKETLEQLKHKEDK